MQRDTGVSAHSDRMRENVDLNNSKYFQKFCACADNTNLVPNQSHDNFWRDGVKQWSDVLHKERFISISISRFLFFFSTSVA